ncbi:MAG: ribonuclease Z [Clostridiales bacterium]|jgi:ribonuclease Z|nr:ribonuclease Z [Clostridiales bacterium]
MLDVALLGTGGMMPLPNRFLTSMLCRFNGRGLMIDAGEGTQVTLKMLGWGCKNIDVICFTHFHADHISGLPGLLLTISNSGRTEPLTLVGPPDLELVVRSICVIARDLMFPLEFRELEARKPSALRLGEFNLRTLPMCHGISCLGYAIEIPRKGRFDAERAKRLPIPVQLWSGLQKNECVEYNGTVYTSDMVLGPERKGLKLCYCTDSRPVSGLADFVRQADLFICEGIYGEEEKKNKAVEYGHMLFSEAAEAARDGEVSELWLTHFSPSLTDPKSFLKNALNIFPNTSVGYDRICKTLYFQDDNGT